MKKILSVFWCCCLGLWIGASAVQAQADIRVTKMASTPTPALNGQFTYTVVVTNLSAVTANNVLVRDVLPTGVTYVMHTQSSGSTYTQSSGLWSILSVPGGSSRMLTIYVRRVTNNSFTNCAQSMPNPSGTVDPNSSNNQSCVTTAALTVNTPPDIQVMKTVSNQTPAVGQSFNWVITVRNVGQSLANNVVVTDQLPAGVSLTGSSTSQGSFFNGTWTVGSLAQGTLATLTLTVTRTSTAQITNCASGSATGDTNTTNNNSCATIPPLSNPPDIKVVKEIWDLPAGGNVNLNDTFTYKITVSNLGGAANVVNVTDQLPAGVQFISASASQGNFSGSTWTVGSLGVGASATLMITVRRTGTASIQNCATGSATGDTNTSNNQGCVTLPPLSFPPDIRVVKTVSTANPTFGANFNYTITVSNIGQGAASSVNVTDQLPVGVQLVGSSATQGSFSGSTWTVGSLNAGASATLTLTVTRTGDAQIVNCATGTTVGDTNTSNNQGCVTIPACPLEPDLLVTKTVNPTNPALNSQFTYTITARNIGQGAGANVVVVDPLPAGISLVGSSATQGSYVGSTWTIGTLQPGQTVTLTLTVTRTGAQAIENCAKGDVAADVNVSNNSSCVTIPAVTLPPDIKVSKEIWDLPVGGNVNLNDTFTYKITVTNGGQGAASVVNVTDQLPAGVQFISASASQGNFSGSTWTVGSLGVGASATLMITVRRISSASIQNCATGTATGDTNTTNNQSCVTLPPCTFPPDIKVVKEIWDLPAGGNVNLNDTFTYKITVSNIGQGAASVVNVTDQLPAGVQFISASASQGNFSGSTWTVGSLGVGASATLMITVRRSGTSQIVNCATGSATGDTNSSNNQGCVTLPELPQNADIRVVKSASNNSPAIGATFTYSVQVFNLGPATANNVVITDVLPAGVSYVSHQNGCGNYNQNTGIWTIGSQPTDVACWLEITVTRTGSQAIQNCANGTASNDTNTSNNNSCHNIPAVVLPPDIRVLKEIWDLPAGGNVNLNDTFTYKITVSNIGQGAASVVNVTDQLPAGVQFISASASQGNFSGSTWTVGSLGVGASATLMITVRRTGTSQIVNCATGSATGDSNTSNNQGCVTLPPVTPACTGGQVWNGTQCVCPSGTNWNGSQCITCPTGQSWNGSSCVCPSGTNWNGSQCVTCPTGQTWNGSQCVCPSGSNWNGSQCVTCTGGQTWNGSQCVCPSGSNWNGSQCITCPTGQSWNGSQCVCPSGTTWNGSQCITQNPDIRVVKEIWDLPVGGNVNLNETFTYKITVSNIGQGAASVVNVTDQLPAGVQFISAQASQGNFSGSTWTVGSLGVGASATLMITVRRTGSASIQNCATGSATGDTNTSNNQSCVTLPPCTFPPDIKVVKEIWDLPAGGNVNLNDTFTYKITVSNIGQGAASVVNVTDQLPAGVQFISASASQGNFSGSTWTVGSLGVGASATLMITVRRIGTSQIVNCATGSATGDINTANNQGCVTLPPVTPTCTGGQVWNGTQCVCPSGSNWNGSQCVTCTGGQTWNGSSCVCPSGTTWNGSQCITQNPDIRVVKEIWDLPVGGNVNLNETFTYKITVSNIGQGAASVVNVTDQLPAGVQFISSSASQGSFSGSTWTVGSLGVGASATLMITVRRIGTSQIVNCATGSATGDTNTANNQGCVTLPPVTPTCTGGQVWNGTQCVCPSGTNWNGSQCITCPAGTTWNGSQCVTSCAGGQVWNGSQCVCPSGTNWNGSQCITCPAGTTWNGSQCVTSCAGGQVWNGSQCVCPSGTNWNGSQCITCPAGTTWNGSQCVTSCAGGQVWNGSQCVCPSGSNWNGSQCVTCTGNQVWNGSQCICPQGQTWNGSQCVTSCTGGQVWNGSQCVCPSGSNWNGSQCVTCPVGTTWNGSQCVTSCAGGQVWNGSQCVCPSGTNWNGSQCITCPAGTTWNGSQCVTSCAGGQVWNGYSCECPMWTWWNNATQACECEASTVWDPTTQMCAARCKGGAWWNASTDTCECPSGQIYNGSQCVLDTTGTSTQCGSATPPWQGAVCCTNGWTWAWRDPSQCTN